MDFDQNLLAEGDHRTYTSTCAIAAPPTSAPGSVHQPEWVLLAQESVMCVEVRVEVLGWGYR